MAPPRSDQHRVNERIRAREVRLIGPDGDQLGIKAVPEALRMSRGLDLDLVEVAPMANPPVCRIMDYGKFRYEEAQKAKEARRKTTHVTIKEVKFRPKIGKGDFDTKMRHLVEFIEDGHKVKVTLQFRGREMAHPELGRKILDDVIVAAGPIAKVENQARMEGRSMSLVLSPDKQAMEAIKKAAEEAEKQAAAEVAAAESTEPIAETDAETTETVAETDAETTEPVAETDAETTEPVAETDAESTEPTAETDADSIKQSADTDAESTDEAPPETSGDE